MNHTLGSTSFIALYSPYEICEIEREIYAKLNSIFIRLDQRPSQDVLNVLDHVNGITGTERGGYEFSVGLHAFGARNTNFSSYEIQKDENYRLL